MPKIPILSGAEMAKVLEKHGYVIVRQKGSHVRLRPTYNTEDRESITVPLHKEIKRGTFMGILRSSGLSIDDMLS
jgi:predicted RNA binding protein YcfA (HicA-like mRNA interferase family)